jgi:GNAT superfamily N-acetyltransferase
MGIALQGETNILIREAVRADLPILQEFEQGIITAERPFNNSLKSELICYYDIAALIDGECSVVMVAEEQGRLVGSGYGRIKQSKVHLSHDLHAYLGFMFVEPTHRGQGINQMIIQALITWGKEQGTSDFYLDAYSDNTSAIRAYEKMGFEQSLVEMKLSDKSTV